MVQEWFEGTPKNTRTMGTNGEKNETDPYYTEDGTHVSTNWSKVKWHNVKVDPFLQWALLSQWALIGKTKIFRVKGSSTVWGEPRPGLGPTRRRKRS